MKKVLLDDHLLRDALADELSAPLTRLLPTHDPCGDEHVSPVTKQTGVWEPMTIWIFWALLRPGDHILDVGANIGWFCVLGARLVGENGRVVANEPDPRNCLTRLGV